MKKRILALLLAVSMMSLTACGGSTNSSSETDANSNANSDIKVGFVYIGAINDEGYTQAHDQGRLALNDMGIPTAYVEDVAEDEGSSAEAIRTLILDEGCNVIYTNSFGFMNDTAVCAEEFPEVYFGHCSGYTQKENMSSYFGKIYEARYLSGIVAGMKTENNKIGYVAAFPIPEVIRGINAFTLGAQSVNPDVSVEVIWTNTWYNPTEEKQAAIELLNKGVDVLAQHQDTTAPQIAAQEKGVSAIGYNTPSPDAAPAAYLTAPLFHWEKFYVDDVQKILDGEWSSRAFWEGLSAGMVSLDALTENCVEGTADAVADAQAKIISGELQIFAGPLTNQAGEVVIAEGVTMADDEVWNMNWLVNGVIGSVE